MGQLLLGIGLIEVSHHTSSPLAGRMPSAVLAADAYGWYVLLI